MDPRIGEVLMKEIIINMTEAELQRHKELHGNAPVFENLHFVAIGKEEIECGMFTLTAGIGAELPLDLTRFRVKSDGVSKAIDTIPYWRLIFLNGTDVIGDIEYLHAQRIFLDWIKNNETAGKIFLDNENGNIVLEPLSLKELMVIKNALDTGEKSLLDQAYWRVKEGKTDPFVVTIDLPEKV